MQSFLVHVFKQNINILNLQKNTKIILLCVLLCFEVGNVASQTTYDINSFRYTNKTTAAKYHYSFSFSNEYQLLLGNIFVFYKKVFSANDLQSCSFYPSCSVYAVESVKDNGFIIGILDSFDRLSRCNGLNSHNYHTHYATGLLYDPVK